MHVDANAIAILYERNWTAIGSFWCNVTNAESPCATAESTIGNQRAV
jgi:hypothetical protein